MVYELQNGQPQGAICFLAPPGLGKTSILKQTRRELRRKNWLCGYSEASPDATTAILDLLGDAREALPAEGIGARFIARLQEFNVTAGPVGIGMKLGGSGVATDYTQLLGLLTSLGELAKHAGVGVALLVDEAQVLPYRDLNLLFRVVSRLDELPIAVIMAGLPNIPDILGGGMNTMPGGVWFASLDPLGAEEAHSILATPVMDSGAEFESSALSRLVEFADGHPLTLQMAGSAAWIEADKATSDGEHLIIQERHAATAMATTLSQLTMAVYKPTFAQCVEPERALLLALANRGAQMLSVKELMADLHGTVSEPHQVLDTLAGRGVIYGGPSVRFVVPGFDEFVRGRSSAAPIA